MGKIENADAAMKRNLEDKTGISFATRVATARKRNFAKRGEIVAFLKSEHGLGHGYANSIALGAHQAGNGVPGSDDLIAAQYAGGTAALRPIYDAVAAAVAILGKDVEISPKKPA